MARNPAIAATDIVVATAGKVRHYPGALDGTLRLRTEKSPRDGRRPGESSTTSLGTGRLINKGPPGDVAASAGLSGRSIL
jgi:hypothetical protein